MTRRTFCRMGTAHRESASAGLCQIGSPHERPLQTRRNQWFRQSVASVKRGVLFLSRPPARPPDSLQSGLFVKSTATAAARSNRRRAVPRPLVSAGLGLVEELPSTRVVRCGERSGTLSSGEGPRRISGHQVIARGVVLRLSQV
jgi:hypothetical protein